MATHEDKQMLRDANGDLIPQYWDIQDEEFKPLTGQDGAQDTRLTGSIADYRIIDGETIQAGAYIEKTIEIKYPFFTLGLLTRGDLTYNTNVDVYFSWSEPELSAYLTLVKIIEFEDDYRYLTDKLETKAKSLRLRIYNSGDEARDFYVTIYNILGG